MDNTENRSGRAKTEIHLVYRECFGFRRPIRVDRFSETQQSKCCRCNKMLGFFLKVVGTLRVPFTPYPIVNR